MTDTDEYDGQIEAAQAAGDNAKANALYQEQMGVNADNPKNLAGLPAVVEDDDTPAGEAEDYSHAAVVPDPVDTGVLEPFLAIFNEYEPDELAKLRQEWPGTEMAANLGYYKWILDNYVSPADRAEVPDSVAMLRIGASVARKVFHELHGNHNKEFTMPDTTNDDAFDAAVDAFDDKIEAARAKGDPGRANRYFSEQQALYKRKFPGGIVDGSGRVA